MSVKELVVGFAIVSVVSIAGIGYLLVSKSNSEATEAKSQIINDYRKIVDNSNATNQGYKLTYNFDDLKGGIKVNGKFIKKLAGFQIDKDHLGIVNTKKNATEVTLAGVVGAVQSNKIAVYLAADPDAYNITTCANNADPKGILTPSETLNAADDADDVCKGDLTQDGSLVGTLFVLANEAKAKDFIKRANDGMGTIINIKDDNGSIGSGVIIPTSIR